MRTYDVKFNEDAKYFNYKVEKVEDFRNMRAFILRAFNGLDKAFICRIVDTVDDIKNLKAGEQMFVASSKYEVYAEKKP